MTRLARIAAIAILFAALAGCTSTTSSATPTANPPTATELLAESAAAMSTVTSARFDLVVDGDLPAVTAKSVNGVLTAEGDAQGTATIEQFGQLIEGEFILVDGDLYLKGVTGGFTLVPAAVAGAVYDPSAILDPDRGVSTVVATIADPSITGTTDDGWTVAGTVPAAVVGGLVPGITTDVAAVLTIAMVGYQLTGATFTLDGADGQPATVTVGLSDFDEPVTISPPG
jgi:lipoprotein LprG